MEQEPPAEQSEEVKQLALAIVPETFTPLEQEQLVKYMRIHKVVFDAEDGIRTNTPNVFGAINKEGKVVDKYFDMDGKFCYIWNHYLFRIYEETFMGNPRLKAMADSITSTLKEEAEGKTLTTGELTTIWERE